MKVFNIIITVTFLCVPTMKVENINDSQQYMSKTLLHINQYDLEQCMTIKIATGVGKGFLHS